MLSTITSCLHSGVLSSIWTVPMKLSNIFEQMIDEYSKFKEVEAIALGGSSVVKNDDISSDYDIYIYCEKEPPVAARKELAEKYSDNPEIDNHYFETGDVFYMRETGKPVDVMYRTLEGIKANIDWVWINCNASLGYTTCFVDNVNKSKILYDRNGKFRTIQELTETPYPEKLAKNIICKNFLYLKDVMFSYYDQLESAVMRNDFVSVNHRISAFLASYFDIIFALNRVLNPGEKKLVEFAIKNCKILPKDFEKDVNYFCTSGVEAKMKTAESLVENLRKIMFI